MKELMALMMEAILKLAYAVDNRSPYKGPRREPREKIKPVLCWNCQKPGYFRNKCHEAPVATGA